MTGMEEGFDYEDLGHSFNFDILLLELYRLMSHVLAHRRIADHAASFPLPVKGPGTPFPTLAPRTYLEKLERTFFQDEVSRLLLFIAVALRNLDNRCRGVFDKYLETCCGEVIEGNQEPTKLTLRNGCNKVIHARHINYGLEAVTRCREMSKFSELPFAPTDLDATVILTGIQSGKEWVAILDLYLYSELITKSVNFHRIQERLALDR